MYALLESGIFDLSIMISLEFTVTIFQRLYWAKWIKKKRKRWKNNQASCYKVLTVHHKIFYIHKYIAHSVKGT